MFALPQRPTLAQNTASSSMPLVLKSLLTVSSTAVSAAVGFLAIGTLVALPSQAQDLNPRLIVQDNSGLRADVGAEIAPEVGRLDPINSPYPLPWSWILDVQRRSLQPSASQMFYYRSPALMSPDGDYSAYARIQVLRGGDPHQSKVNSLLFLENTETGELQFLTATSPEMQSVLLQGADSQQPGMLSMLMPISWSESGDRVLVRAFESIFSTDIAADYALIWHQASNQVQHIIPTNAQYSHSVLLGWSQTNPDEVLFEVGNLGDEQRLLMAMAEAGQYQMVASDEPITYGKTTTTFWHGPQASVID